MASIVLSKRLALFFLQYDLINDTKAVIVCKGFATDDDDFVEVKGGTVRSNFKVGMDEKGNVGVGIMIPANTTPATKNIQGLNNTFFGGSGDAKDCCANGCWSSEFIRKLIGVRL